MPECRAEVREAIQAAALADHLELADEIVRQHDLNVCRRCAVAASAVDYRCRWAVCGPCYELLAPTQLVLRSKGPAGGHVFDDWVALMAVLHQKRGSIKTVVFDDTNGPCEIPAGAWDMAGCDLQGLRPLPHQARIVSHGATLHGPVNLVGLHITCVAIQTGDMTIGGI